MTSQHMTVTVEQGSACGGDSGSAGHRRIHWIGRREIRVALDRSWKKLFDKARPNDETRREILADLSGQGQMLLVVDQPATIGALPVEAARSMPHTLRSIALDDEMLAELGVFLCGFDDDLAAHFTATSNRIRGLLTQIHPALERALGPHRDHPAVADLLIRYPA
ncbi:hypothetical protein BJ994_001708 [Arthrobacter pigmenti]|uniref:Transposase IS110-like N-terminal domain-containing protein n=1 Tax=Arthrobacter pigmenti TaxID=271432 RepID=A0A846RPX3_9MICC|nr:hypothetical protein [Arthrobacter pigmenti]